MRRKARGVGASRADPARSRRSSRGQDYRSRTSRSPLLFSDCAAHPKQSRMAGVFVSYRRDDSAYALLLYKALAQKFGSARVFRDFDSIAPGQDFVAVLDAALAQCAACVVIVGRGWLDALDRLASPDDFVRREIAAILDRGTLLIPCLVGGSKMPGEPQLPAVLPA